MSLKFQIEANLDFMCYIKPLFCLYPRFYIFVISRNFTFYANLLKLT